MSGSATTVSRVLGKIQGGGEYEIPLRIYCMNV